MALVLVLAGCGSKKKQAASAAAAAGAPRGIPVRVEVAVQKPIADTSTYVASIQSLSSTTISPQVTGILQSINITSGERVRQGQLLMQINPEAQAAQVQNLEHSRSAQASTVQFDQQQLKRSELLYEEKIGTLQDYQQAQSAEATAESQLRSLDAQIRQAQVTLGYYRIVAPRAGIVGDIPVRVGDTVTSGTTLTTLDSTQGTQLYVQVPLEQSSKLKTGLPVAVLNAQGAVLAHSTIFFVSPQVDPATQTILAKAAIPAAEAAGLRTQQYVQARITWGSHMGFSVPVLAEVEEAGGSFLDLAQPAGKGFVVHEQQVTLGDITGNNVEVLSGLRAGDKVIVSQHQILAQGMPVIPLPAGGGGRPSPGAQGAPGAGAPQPGR
ncbi:MAG: efflux RND transporter periplasmic adaptor subunit [Terriglobales bacterium]